MDISKQFASVPTYTGPGLATHENGGWRTHAIADNGNSLKGDEPGYKWGRYAALVPVHQLLRYREYDRAGAQGYSNSKENINNIAQDLSAHGIDGLREPVHLKYDHDRKWGVLTEGNHRLAAAIQAGVTHLPVIVHARGGLEEEKRSRVGAPLHMDTRLHEEDVDYHPSTVHPGNFQEFEGAR
jgi:hypothetical protein